MADRANAASVAIFSKDHVLLIQRAFEPMAGYWTFPGGRLEAGETSKDCALREVKEEMQLALPHIVPVLTQSSGDFTIEVFAGWLETGTPAPSTEIMNWAWVTLDEFGTLKTTPNLVEIALAARHALTLM